ncbi:MAG: hypothetical protein ING19_08955 [Azospirillum sp.]|nr:hypothetical protein [Azospirillum sp.]
MPTTKPIPGRISRGAKPDRPVVGMVMVYRYLWRHEREAGSRYPEKNRPVVVVAVMEKNGRTEVMLHPISTRHQSDERIDIFKLSEFDIHAAGLDRGSSVVVSEHNVEDWSSPDFVEARGVFVLGFLHPRIANAIRAKSTARSAIGMMNGLERIDGSLRPIASSESERILREGGPIAASSIRRDGRKIV